MSENVSQQVASVALFVKAEVTVDFEFADLFSLTRMDANKCAKSASITMDGQKWWLEVYPHGRIFDHTVACFVCSDEPDCFSAFTVEALNGTASKAVYKKSCSTADSSTDQGRGWDKFAFGEHFLRDVVTNGKATFRVHLKVFDQRVETVDGTPQPSKRPCMQPAVQLDPAYSDLTLIVDGQRLPTFKCLLCPRSAVFQAMCQHPMKEAATGEVEIHNHTVAAVQAMLDFIHGSIAEPRELLGELLALAVFFQIADLRAFVEEHWTHCLTPENVLENMHIATAHGCNKLQAEAVRYVVANAKVLLTRSDFLGKLDVDTAVMLLQALGGVVSTNK